MSGIACVGDLCTTVFRSLAETPGANSHKLPDWDGYLTIAIIAIGLIILFKNWIKTEFVMMGILTTLMWLQVVNLKEALEGFSSASILTVMVLLGVAEGISQTGALDAFFRKVLGRPTSCSAAITRMALPVCFWSSFLNNTPVVALMIPILVTWSRAIKQPVSKLMIPLSYVSELGGVCTLIGTSTNLVVKELYDKALKDDPTLPVLTIFSQTRFGVPIALLGVLYIVIFGYKILPGRSTHTKRQQKAAEEEPIQVGMFVPSNSTAVGRTVMQAGLTDMVDLKLTHIRRDGQILPLLDLQYQVIRMYDEIYVSGDMQFVDTLAAQLQLKIVTDEFDSDPFLPVFMRSSGNSDALDISRDGVSTALLDASSAPAKEFSALYPSPHQAKPTDPAGARVSGISRDVLSQDVDLVRLVHVSVRSGAPIVGETIKNVLFRGRFDAAVVDVRRGIKRVPGSISSAVLQSGDELMLDAGATFDLSSSDMLTNFEDIRYVKTPAKQFMMALEVPEGSDLVGKNLEEAGLRGMGNAYITTIQRNGEKLHAVSPQVKLMASDVLWLTGSTDSVQALRNRKGLRPLSPQRTTVASRDRELMQAVLSSHSPLLGKRAFDADFEQFNVSLLAVHRSGTRLVTDMADVYLKTGDVLLLEGDRDFVKQHENDDGFALLTVLDDSSPTKWDRSILALLLLLLLIIGQVAQSVLMKKPFIPFLPASAAVVAVMLLTRCLSPAQLHKALKWDLYLTIACAIGISNALQTTRVASMFARALVSLGKQMGGDLFIQAALYIATALLSNVIANNAAAALLFPIVLNISKEQGIKLENLTYLLMFGASSAFMTPYGYQTNLMVQDVGGYVPMDFLKFGGPFQLWQTVGTLAIMAFPEQWIISWVVVGIACAAVFVPILGSDTSTFKILRRHAVSTFTRGTPEIELDSAYTDRAGGDINDAPGHSTSVSMRNVNRDSHC